MTSKITQVDKPFLLTLFLLVMAGFFILSSASLSLLSRQGPSYGSVMLNQSIGLVAGIMALIVTSKLDYRIWRKYAFHILLIAIVINLLVFVPGVGFAHNGATRWINLRFFTFQPSELLKIAFIVYFAAWISKAKERIKETKYGLIPFIITVGIVGGVALLQSDTDVLITVFLAGLTMLFISGIRWRDIGLLIITCMLVIGLLAYTRPYVRARINTFIHPTMDKQGSGYQIQQSLIAIGSGGLFGRGFGQSIQKFGFLPEPIGDSIFAVYAEEFGFVGTTLLLIIFVFFAVRGLKIVSNTPDTFGALLALGIMIVYIAQFFMNIGSMTGIIPLSGMPLPFVSQGGTALIFFLAEAGIILNISKHQK